VLQRIDKKVSIEYSKIGVEAGVIGASAWIIVDYFERVFMYR
jgi:hypothetical protein